MGTCVLVYEYVCVCVGPPRRPPPGPPAVNLQTFDAAVSEARGFRGLPEREALLEPRTRPPKLASDGESGIGSVRNCCGTTQHEMN